MSWPLQVFIYVSTQVDSGWEDMHWTLLSLVTVAYKSMSRRLFTRAWITCSGLYGWRRWYPFFQYHFLSTVSHGEVESQKLFPLPWKNVVRLILVPVDVAAVSSRVQRSYHIKMHWLQRSAPPQALAISLSPWALAAKQVIGVPCWLPSTAQSLFFCTWSSC